VVVIRRRTMLKLLGGLAVAGVGGGLYSTVVENSMIGFTSVDLYLGLNIKVVHISDTHMDTSIFDVGRVLDMVGEVDPDIIVHTGDILTTLSGLESSIDFLVRLSRMSSVYVVVGNHDHWSGITPGVLGDKLSGYDNIHVFDNDALFIDGFWIVGVDDPYTFNDDIDKALYGLDDYYPKILISHSPQIIGKAMNRVDVVLAGHTHGGQVRIPFVGPLWLPLPKRFWKYDYGLFREGSTRMFVTRGLGTTFLPVRFNCPPEIVLINF
jgi:hypothetical protein